MAREAPQQATGGFALIEALAGLVMGRMLGLMLIQGVTTGQRSHCRGRQ